MDKCETCVWYVYDEDYDDYICDMDLDEDELARFLAADTRSCAAAPRCRCSSSAPLPRRAAAPRPPASFCQKNVVSFAFEPSLTLGELL